MTEFHELLGDEPGYRSTLPTIYSVVYCSRASEGVDETEVQRIVTSAQIWNQKHQITGLLVFGSGIFFQWLEGPRERVISLVALLRTDRRHGGFVVLDEVEEVRERLFPDWGMERVGSEHIREVLEDALGNASDSKSEKALQQLLAQLDSPALSGLSTAD